jgi:translation elongation factor EF-Tu-like GTPase
MPVEEVFSTAAGTVVTGRIEQVIVHAGDFVEIAGSAPVGSPAP